MTAKAFSVVRLLPLVYLFHLHTCCSAFCVTSPTRNLCNSTPDHSAHQSTGTQTRHPTYHQSIQLKLQRQCSNESSDRRSFIDTLVGGAVATTAATVSSLLLPSSSYAEESQSFKRTNTKLNFGYEFLPPPSVIKTSNKPLQTHLDEINLPTDTKGYTYGVTVDPIRLKSLKEFGTPEEVAAKIVMAELRRDGVLDVTLAADAKEDDNSGAYDVQYISDGTRGKKHFVTRTVVKDGKLFVLTVQAKQIDWDNVKGEVLDAVQSFHVLENDAY